MNAVTSGYRNYANSFVTWLLLIFALGIETGAASVAGVAAASNMFSKAVAFMESGANQEASQVYDDIIRQGRISRDIHKALYLKGVCLQAMKQDQQALVCWNTLLTRYTGTEWDDDVLLEMGNTYALNLNQPEKALLCYERLIRNYPRSERLTEAQFQLGVAAYMKGDYGKARASFEAVRRKDPQGGLAGEAQEWLGRISMALSNAPSAASKLMSKTDQPSRKTMGLERDLAAELAEAESIQNKGDYKEALKAFQRITRNFMRGEGYDRALFRLGQCQAALGNEQDAIAAWEEVLRFVRLKQPCEYADDSLLAQAETWLNSLDRPDRAMQCCQTLQTEYPQSELIPQAEHLVGLVYFYQDELDKARDIFEQELAKAPRSTDTNAPLTGLERLIAACQGRQAAGFFKAGMKNTAGADPLIRIGDMQFTAKDYAKARQTYERAIRKATGTETAAYALLQAGRCLNQMRQYRQALWCYEQFLTKYRQSEYADDALLRAGVIYVGPLHDMASGAKMYSTILERYPDSNAAETAQYHLATLAYWKKEWKRALEEHERLLREYPDGRYAGYVESRRLPEIKMALRLKEAKKAS